MEFATELVVWFLPLDLPINRIETITGHQVSLGADELLLFFLSFSIYCLALAFEHYRQVSIVHSGLQDESLQVTISKLP